MWVRRVLSRIVGGYGGGFHCVSHWGQGVSECGFYQPLEQPVERRAGKRRWSCFDTGTGIRSTEWISACLAPTVIDSDSCLAAALNWFIWIPENGKTSENLKRRIMDELWIIIDGCRWLLFKTVFSIECIYTVPMTRTVLILFASDGLKACWSIGQAYVLYSSSDSRSQQGL